MTFFSQTVQSERVKRTLLRTILRDVSRSFYLSLVVLPKAVRQQVGLAYLFCRAADTIADTDILARHERLRVLESFRCQFRLSDSCKDLTYLQNVPLPQRVTEGERKLLMHLPDCFRVLAHFSLTDRQLITDLVLTLTRGMEMDLRAFPGETAATARALPNMHALDLYTYYVAGVVGEFWTKIHVAHLPNMRHLDCLSLCRLGVSFGKGLQLTNILKDLGKDLHNGRCYLPEKCLEQVQIKVETLQDTASLPRLRPLLRTLMTYTLAHLDRACEYVMHLPYLAVRSRLSCMWPLLFAVQTLAMVWQSDQLLNPHLPVKISRRTVYLSMFNSLGCLVFPGLLAVYYRHLRSHLVALLEQTKGPSGYAVS
ncbi:MAG: squalene/phytoene synthase family protein [bacterium]|nr:squalene/phytoene synthase family protein [bacterium]